MLAAPMTVLFGASEVIARLVDRRRRTALDDLDDDEASDIEDLDDPDDLDGTGSDETYAPSGLGEEDD
jgi:hypothetical protein